MRFIRCAVLCLCVSACGDGSRDDVASTSEPLCKISDQGDGSKLITCDDGTKAVVRDGMDGANGDRGPRGEPGTTGPRGPRGDTGAPGDKGPTGPRGPTGPNGPSGPKGDQGNPGAPGASVVLASEGPGGNCGDEGGISVTVGATTEYVCNGADGAQGMKGDTGDMGSPGDPGMPGADGIDCWDLNGDGDCDDLAGAPGDEDTNGDDVCDVLDCQGPKGDTGDQGVKGDKGDPGDPASAPTLLDANGNALGRLLWMEGGRFSVLTDDGIVLRYSPSGALLNPFSSGVVGIDYESTDCTGTPLFDSGEAPAANFGVLTPDGNLWRVVEPKLNTTVNSGTNADTNVCEPFALTTIVWTLELVGPSPGDATAPLTVVP